MWSADVFTRACSRDRRMMPPEREKVRQLDHPCEIGPDCRESKGVRALHRHDEARYENRSAMTPPRIANAKRPRLRPVATAESASGLSSIWTEVTGSHDCEAAAAFAIA